MGNATESRIESEMYNLPSCLRGILILPNFSNTKKHWLGIGYDYLSSPWVGCYPVMLVHCKQLY